MKQSCRFQFLYFLYLFECSVYLENLYFATAVFCFVVLAELLSGDTGTQSELGHGLITELVLFSQI